MYEQAARFTLMPSLEESLASWATVVGTVLSIFGLIQSRAWLTAISVVVFGVALIATSYARREHQTLRGAAMSIEGRNLDSLNVANLRRRTTKNLVLQEAHQIARIEGEDLNVTWRYSGYCRTALTTMIEFSVDADSNVPFAELACFGYDLQQDPQKAHPIRPILIGADGISKKIGVPFLQPLKAEQPFDVLLQCKLPGCMKGSLSYYTSTLSFEQENVATWEVRLIFVGQYPEWVRVYECLPLRMPVLLKDLPPTSVGRGRREYVDSQANVKGISARVYLFRRPEA